MGVIQEVGVRVRLITSVHPPRGVNTTDTTVLVPINMIKIANTKIIKAKLYKDIINEQDSIINLHKIKYNALYKEVEILQNNLDNSNKVNDNLNKYMIVLNVRIDIW